MSRSLQASRKAKLIKRFPNCYYCHEPMVYFTLKPHQATPPRYCTFEHLNARHDYPNNKRPPKGRIVLACYECNSLRSNTVVKNKPKEWLWEQSGRRPQQQLSKKGASNADQ